MSKDTRSQALRPLRDLIIIGNLMAMKIGDDPNNLANTWDEMVVRLRESGILQQVAKSAIMVDTVEAEYADTLGNL